MPMVFTEDQIRRLFVKNTAILRQKSPGLWQIASSEGKGCEVEVDEEGRINAKLRGTPVYKTDAYQVSLSQVEAFEAKPIRLFPDSDISNRGGLNPEIIANRYSLELLEKLPNKLSPPSCQKTRHLPVLLMVGLSFGLHLKLLLERYEVQNLIILDVPVFFRLSLYTLDWQWLFEYYSKPGRSLNIIVHNKLVLEKDLEIAFAELRRAIGAINPGLFYWGYYFEHIRHNPPMRVKEWLSRNPIRWYFNGSFDEQLWFLQWTLNNCRRKIPLYYPQKKVPSGAVAFVLGAGPSLDYAIGKIRQYQDKAVIFSCGTTISALQKAGIIPDFHVEIERDKSIYETLSEVNRDFLGQVRFITVNRMLTDCFDLFKKSYMFCALNYPSVSLLAPTGAPILTTANSPTVTGAGVALAAEFGFDTIFLFGVDLGSKNPQKHHSSLTNYYNPDSMLQKFEVKFYETLPGNFGGQVYTDIHFRDTKYHIENTIRVTGVKVYNTSDGAKIEGAVPLPIESFKVEGNFDKEKAIKIIEENFDTRYIDFINPYEVFRRLYEQMGLFSSKLREAHKSFDYSSIHDVVHSFLWPLSFIASFQNPLLEGCLLYQLNNWSKLALGYALSLEEEERREFMEFFWDMYLRFLEEAKGEIKKFMEEFGK